MTPMTDRPGCPSCRTNLVRRLRGERHTTPDWPAPMPARHWGAGAATAIVAAIGLISAGVAAYGQYQASQQQAAALEFNAIQARYQAAYQAQLGEFQGKLLERQALGALTLNEAQAALQEQQALANEAAGKLRAEGIRLAYDRNQSEVRAAIGKSGVDTTGSPLMVLLAGCGNSWADA
jgi:hypothetical protein